MLPALEALQLRVGWISETGLDYVCVRLGVPPADAWGVATFYALLSTTPRAPRVLHVCDDIACRCKGAAELVEALEREVGPAHAHGPSGDHVHVDPGSAVWVRSPCLGLCDQAPAAFLQQAGEQPVERLLGKVILSEATDLLFGHAVRTDPGKERDTRADPSPAARDDRTNETFERLFPRLLQKRRRRLITQS